MVEVTVVVHDDTGHAIMDLTKDEFQIFDKGKRQRISQFSMAFASSVRPNLLPPPEPGTYSNRGEITRDTTGNVVAILIDFRNTEPEDIARIRRDLSSYVARLRPNDQIAIFKLGEELSVTCDFTNDAEQLRRSLQSINVSKDVRMSGSDDLFVFQVKNFYKTVRGIETPEVLASIGRHLAGIPGRKSLVWITGSFPVATGSVQDGNRRSFDTEISRAAEVLADSGVAVYPIDARGLLSGGSQGMIPVETREPDIRTFASMDEFADLTGGAASYNTNDLSGAIGKAIEDARVTYSLGYYPDDSNWDGSFHPISVKVLRSGARVRCRTGYFSAVKPGGNDQGQISERMLRAAADPLDATAVGLRLRLNDQANSAPEHLRVIVTVNPQDLTLAVTNNVWTGGIRILCVEVGSKQDVLSTLGRTIPLALTRKGFEKTMNEGVKVDCDLPRKAGTTLIRVVVIDEPSGRVGTLSLRLNSIGE